VSVVLSRIRSFWHGLVRRRALESEMDEEFRLHLELRTEDLVRAGLSPAEAARRARVEFGSVPGHKEAARNARGLRIVDGLRTEVRHAARFLWRSPGFTGAAVLTLALGVAANATSFSVVNASLLRPPPFDDPRSIVVLHQTHARPGAEPGRFRWWSYPQVEALGETLTTLSHLSAYYATDLNLSHAAREPLRARVEFVSASYFPALGVRPAAGRGFLPAEDGASGAHPVAILGHELWNRGFGADPAVLGSELFANGVAVTVVGIAPAGFRGITGEAQLWLPHAMAPPVYFANFFTSDQYFLGLVGRLARGTSLDRARAEMASAGAAAAAGVRATGGADDWSGEWSAGLERLTEARRDPRTVRAQLVLAGTSLLVLLIAVVNLGSLMLARSRARARETAVRSALGASRARLVRHALVEGGLLGLAAGALGVLLSVWAVRAWAAFAPEYLGGARLPLSRAGLAAFAEPAVDGRVMAFAGALALAAGMVAALVPALRIAEGGLPRALSSGARASAGAVGTLRRPTALAVATKLQVACALVLLAGAAMLARGYHELRSADPGFEPAGLLTFRISAPEHRYGGEAAAPLIERILEGVAAVPGVQTATVGNPPFSGGGLTSLYIAGRPAAEPAPIVGRFYVGPDHFRTLGIPLLRGRALTADDRAGRPRVAVINETAARRFWPGEDPIGKRVWFGGGGGFATPDSLTEIVGVVADVLYGAPGDGIGPDFYTSYLQHVLPRADITVRASGDLSALVPALRRAVREVDPYLPIHGVETMERRAAQTLAAERFAAAALSAYALLGLILASVGVYGIMAYSVAQRRREIGIRIALGATPEVVLRLVVGQGAVIAAAGIALGAVALLLIAPAFRALVSGVGTVEPFLLAAVAATLLLIAMLACWLAGRPATRVSPIEALGAD
jgi:putative ABC transport system permease protein